MSFMDMNSFQDCQQYLKNLSTQSVGSNPKVVMFQITSANGSTNKLSLVDIGSAQLDQPHYIAVENILTVLSGNMGKMRLDAGSHRQSSLTSLIQDCLDHDSHVLVLPTIRAGAEHFNDAQNVLTFASTAYSAPRAHQTMTRQALPTLEITTSKTGLKTTIPTPRVARSPPLPAHNKRKNSQKSKKASNKSNGTPATKAAKVAHTPKQKLTRAKTCPTSATPQKRERAASSKTTTPRQNTTTTRVTRSSSKKQRLARAVSTPTVNTPTIDVSLTAPAALEFTLSGTVISTKAAAKAAPFPVAEVKHEVASNQLAQAAQETVEKETSVAAPVTPQRPTSTRVLRSSTKKKRLSLPMKVIEEVPSVPVAPTSVLTTVREDAAPVSKSSGAFRNSRMTYRTPPRNTSGSSEVMETAPLTMTQPISTPVLANDTVTEPSSSDLPSEESPQATPATAPEQQEKVLSQTITRQVQLTLPSRPHEHMTEATPEKVVLESNVSSTVTVAARSPLPALPVVEALSPAVEQMEEATSFSLAALPAVAEPEPEPQAKPVKQTKKKAGKSNKRKASSVSVSEYVPKKAAVTPETTCEPADTPMIDLTTTAPATATVEVQSAPIVSTEASSEMVSDAVEEEAKVTETVQKQPKKRKRRQLTQNTSTATTNPASQTKKRHIDTHEEVEESTEASVEEKVVMMCSEVQTEEDERFVLQGKELSDALYELAALKTMQAETVFTVKQTNAQVSRVTKR